MRTLHASLFGPTGRPDCFRTGPPCALHGTGGPDCPRDSRSLGQPVALAPPDLRQPSAWCPHTRHPPRSSRALTAGPGTRPVACVYKSSEPTASHDQSRTVTDSHGQSRLVEAMEYRPVSGSPSRSSAESPSHDFAALEAAGPAHAVCLVGLATSPCPWPAKSGSWHCAGLTPGAEPTRGFASRRPPPPASPASAGYRSLSRSLIRHPRDTAAGASSRPPYRALLRVHLTSQRTLTPQEPKEREPGSAGLDLFIARRSRAWPIRAAHRRGAPRLV